MPDDPPPPSTPPVNPTTKAIRTVGHALLDFSDTLMGSKSARRAAEDFLMDGRIWELCLRVNGTVFPTHSVPLDDRLRIRTLDFHSACLTLVSSPDVAMHAFVLDKAYGDLFLAAYMRVRRR